MINYDVKKMYEWPLPIQFIVIGLVAVILLYLGYITDISSLQREIETGYSNEQDLKKQLTASYMKQISAANDMVDLSQLQETLKQWQGKLIDASQLPDLQDQILKLGQQSQLKIDSFNPSTPIKDGEYTKIPITISAVGTYDQIASFLSQVANMNNLVRIADFTIGRLPTVGSKQANQITNVQNNAANDDSTADQTSVINSDTLLKADLNLEIYRK